MNDVTSLAKIVFASTFAFYFKASTYHWNVEGPAFPLYHGFFGDIYEEVYGSIDQFAEEIRALGEYAPRSLNEMIQYSALNQNNAYTAIEMIVDLKKSNDVILEGLVSLFNSLDTNQGFQDFIASRIDAHKKHGWMLNSTLK